MRQPQYVFHQDPLHCKDPKFPPAPSLDDCRRIVDPKNPKCLFNSYVGQDHAKRKLSRVLISALQKYNHEASEVSWLLTGPSSVGKTTLAKIFAKILRLPFIEINPTSIKKLDEIFAIIAESLERVNLPLVDTTGTEVYKLPPCIIFIDEAHALNKRIQDGLLKAIEGQDRLLITENKTTISTARVCWMMATTDVGDLSHALVNRFSEIALKPYTRNEIAKIVNIKFKDWDIAPCAIAAYFESRIPRKAIEFAQEMHYEKINNPTADWLNIGITIAKENDIDELGMPLKQLKILQSLIKRPVSKEKIANMLNITSKELSEFIIPWMIADSYDCPALISVSTSGYRLTVAGFEELKKRNLVMTLPKYLEDEDDEDEVVETKNQPINSSKFEIDFNIEDIAPIKYSEAKILENVQSISNNFTNSTFDTI